jgi:PilX N-terminal
MTRLLEPTRKRSRRGIRRPGERGAALVVAILVLTILTVIGIALMLITSTESRIAANEWSVNRAFYSADAGLRWASVAIESSPSDFMRRPEFCGQPAPCPDLAHAFGNVIFPLPSFRHGAGGFFTGEVTLLTPLGEGRDITVRVQSPSLLGRRPYRGGRVNEGEERGQFTYGFEVRSTGGQNDPVLQYSKALVADVELGPMPARLPFTVTP